MDRVDMIKMLMVKANISHDEAKEVLEKCNWDVLEAVIHLERQGKIANNDITTIIEVASGAEEEERKEERHHEKFGGFGEIIGRILKGMGKIVRKGNETYLEIRKDKEKPIRIPLTVTVLLVIFLTAPSVILGAIGLFCGYKYSIGGSNTVNTIFDEMAESANNLKRDFKKGYGK